MSDVGFYTLAEAIVKVQSGEWKFAMSKDKMILEEIVGGELLMSRFPKGENLPFIFSDGSRRRQWGEYRCDESFCHSDVEAYVGIRKDGEIWERQVFNFPCSFVQKRWDVRSDQFVGRVVRDGYVGSWSVTLWDDSDAVLFWRKALVQMEEER